MDRLSRPADDIIGQETDLTRPDLTVSDSNNCFNECPSQIVLITISSIMKRQKLTFMLLQIMTECSHKSHFCIMETYFDAVNKMKRSCGGEAESE